MSDFKAKMAHVWGSAPWERAEHTLAVVHEHLLRVLYPTPGERFLDVATGTGAVARAAARRGADVLGVDLAPALVETAKRLASEEGLDARFAAGDAEDLPCEDASFDAVASSMGVIFAPDHARVAAELARVTRRGGRLAFSAWAESFFDPVLAKYRDPDPDASDSLRWSEPGYARELLGSAFDLRFEEGDAPLRCGSGEDAWDLLSTSVGPFRACAKSLPDDTRAELRGDFVEYMEGFRREGEIVAPHRYVLVAGTRR